MITKSTQNWTAGSSVKVGFLTLSVVTAVATPGDCAPDAYVLTNAAGSQLYKFVPHAGLTKLTMTEARELVATAKLHADRMAAAAIAKAKQHGHTIEQLNALIFAGATA